MTMEVGSFVGELVRVNEKVDVEDVRDRLGDGCESDVTAMALRRDVSNFKTKMTFLTGARIDYESSFYTMRMDVTFVHCAVNLYFLHDFRPSLYSTQHTIRTVSSTFISNSLP